MFVQIKRNLFTAAALVLASVVAAPIAAPANASTLLAVDEISGGGHEIVSFSGSLARGGLQSISDPITGFAADSTGRYVATGANITKYDTLGNAVASVAFSSGSSINAISASGNKMYIADHFSPTGANLFIAIDPTSIVTSGPPVFVGSPITGL